MKKTLFASLLLILALNNSFAGYYEDNFFKYQGIEDSSQNQTTNEQENQQEAQPIIIDGCTHQYNIAKAQYLARKEQLDIEKRKASRSVGNGLLTAATALIVRNNNSDQFTRDVLSGVAIAGGIVSIAGEAKRQNFRHKGNNLELPEVMYGCEGKWDMSTFKQANKGTPCSIEDFVTYGPRGNYENVRTFVCGKNRYERIAMLEFLKTHNIFKNKREFRNYSGDCQSRCD